MNDIEWCCTINNGIKLVEENLNLSRAYLEKSRKSLDAVSKLEGNKDWQISSAYYAMYFSLYSILMRVGLECENHKCTLTVIKEYFKDFAEDMDFLFNSKEARIDAQYYPDKDVDNVLFNKMIKKAPKIYAKSKEINLKLSEDTIERIRESIGEYL